MPVAAAIHDHQPDVAALRPLEGTDLAGVDVVAVAITGAPSAQGTPGAPGGSGVDDAAGSAVQVLYDVPGADEIAAAARAVGASTSAGATTRLPALPGVGDAAGATVLLVGTDLPRGSAVAPTRSGQAPVDGAVDLDHERLRRAAGAVGRAARGLGTVALLLDPERPEVVATGAGLGSYRPAKVTASDSSDGADGADADNTATGSSRRDSSDVLLVRGSDPTATSTAVERATSVVRAVGIARDLVNTPPNLLYPETFAARVGGIARSAGLEVEVLEPADLEAEGYGGLLAVGGGSARGPRLLRLTHRAAEGRPTIGLVGKGVTFDTGGISIKPAAGMEKMTSDMGGAAAVCATAVLAGLLGLDATVVATVPLAENMPSATAYRPGDVLTMLDGTTVEVLNTDAEGRLILADALVRAGRDEPDYLIDVATLTGAQMVALGATTPGIMGHDTCRDRVARLSQEVGENGWPMPLPDELRDGLDSTVADLTNVTPARWGGMLSAALFLREFVPAGPAWAHVDIAGPAFNDGSAGGYLPKGATGVPVRSLFAFCEDVATHD